MAGRFDYSTKTCVTMATQPTRALYMMFLKMIY
ncbi:hypothetical protein T4C_4360 [Trichinella pseudospiralis]|uniref:Uncharacterized protein n=1 Tax=Trichinella pseudospiralis TaxID=6337 RepID=A0A0V1GFI5_TRIPS|nr:hypothetical protein T4C_4360 [Trichinella pseudospiralis]